MYRTHYQPNYYSIRNQVKRSRPAQSNTARVYTADQVWGAAAYADRRNDGEYRKEPEYRVQEDGTYTNEVVREANRTHLWQALRVLGDANVITESDVETGRAARDYVRKNLVFKRLKGNLSEFETALCSAVDMDEFIAGSDRYEIALVTSQIRAYHEGQRMQAIMEDVVQAPVAAVGEKVRLAVQVVKCVYSQNYNVYFITAKTDGNQMVFFSYRERQPVGERMTIKGTVKAHRPDATQLNRVRIA